jgi:hypothetical protein
VWCLLQDISADGIYDTVRHRLQLELQRPAASRHPELGTVLYHLLRLEAAKGMSPPHVLHLVVALTYARFGKAAEWQAPTEGDTTMLGKLNR